MPSKYSKRGSLMVWINDHLAYDGDDCLLWPFGKSKTGYALITKKKKKISVHRYICEKVYGDKPFNDAITLHSCGNGHLGCVNPRHLRWGTYKQNTQDAREAGTISRGENRWNNTLTEEQVIEIYIKAWNKHDTNHNIGLEYGITRGHVSQIKLKYTWKWLTDKYDAEDKL